MFKETLGALNLMGFELRPDRCKWPDCTYTM